MEEGLSKIVLRLSKSVWNQQLTVQTCNDDDEGRTPMISSLGNPSPFTPRKRALSNSSIGNYTGPERMFTLADVSAPSEIAMKRMKEIKSQLSTEVLNTIPCSSYRSVDHSVLTSVAIKDSIGHCVSLHTETTQKLLMPLLQKLIHHQRNTNIFNQPVDAIALGIPQYITKIKHPMDLGTVKGILLSGQFSSFVEVCDLIRLVFDNATTFNHRSTDVYQNAKALKAEFEADLNVVLEKISKEEERKCSPFCTSCFGTPCSLCGERCLKLELPFILCAGPCCQRIKRNSVFYVTSDATRQWCQKCYSGLSQVIDARQSAPLLKKDLLKRKTDEEVLESWISCGQCGSRMHEICALYSPLFKSPSAPQNECNSFLCPSCLIVGAQAPANSEGTSLAKEEHIEVAKKQQNSPNSVDVITSANAGVGDDVQIMKLFAVVDGAVTDSEQDNDVGADPSSDNYTHEDKSSAYGTEVLDETDSEASCGFSSVEKITDARAPDLRLKESKHSNSAHMTQQEQTYVSPFFAKTLPRTKLSDFLEAVVLEKLHSAGFGAVAKTVTIRMVSNVDQYQEVPSVIRENLMTCDGRKIPLYMPYRQKCILLFQEIDGIDVCLFCLYVQEFDANCPEPNRSKVYISYLDSVEYFRPMEARTMVYHELMVGYLQWAQFRGFEQCNIWSCPPQRGDNFIFWCHPQYQRTPSRERLGTWYMNMLNRATALGVVEKTTNLYAAYFQDYSKRERDRSIQRQASKNSFVGLGGASKDPLPLERTVSNASTTTAGPPPPVSPPIFEGDYWVNECAKVYRVVLGRAKNGDGNDKMTNHRDARELIKTMMSKPTSYLFNQPVDPIALEIPTYYDVIKEPMDLKTVQEKVRGSTLYSNLLQFAEDVRLTFKNAMLFNPAGHFVHTSAQTLLEDFEKALYDLMVFRVGIVAEIEGLDSWLATLMLRDDPVYKPLGNGLSSELTISRSQSMLSITSENMDQTISDIETYISPQPHATAFEEFEINTNIGIDNSKRALSRTSSEENDAQKLRRLNSSESVADGLAYEDDSFVRRSYATRACIGLPPEAMSSDSDEFGKPQLGYRGAASLMQELSKSVQRLKDDLFVAVFAKPDIVISKAKQQQDHQKDQDQEISITTIPVRHIPKGKGRPPLSKKHDVKFASDIISERCMSMLEVLARNTSDPDDQILCPLADFRPTFLEVCQFRHYQFDSLRRAKHSSASLLYHIHNPFAAHIRPTCASCAQVILNMRWHCDMCSNFDICEACNGTNIHPYHELVPIRVTFY